MGGPSEHRPVDARGRGRELVLGALCHLEELEPAERPRALKTLLEFPPAGDEDGEAWFAQLAGDASARRFAESLLGVILPNWNELDAAIRATSRRWRLERMDSVDRNVLRIGAAELSHRGATPPGVILAEAARLASSYGNERSASFVNGVASSLAERLRAAGAGEGDA